MDNTMYDDVPFDIDETSQIIEPIEEELIQQEQEVIQEQEIVKTEEPSSPQISANDDTTEKVDYEIISKNEFNNFIKSLNILKNFVTILNIKNGITSFINDSNIYVIQFDCNCPKISLILPYPQNQISQLSFLSKSSAVKIKDEGSIYKFWNDENIKFAVRKGIVDNKTMIEKAKYDSLYESIKNTKLIMSYDFKDSSKINLDQFLSIVEVVKNPHINLYSEKNSNNKDDLIFSIGDLNGSGVFDLFRINNLELDWLYDATQSSSNSIINTLIDKSIFCYNYSNLKISIYCKDPDNQTDPDKKLDTVNSIFILIEATFSENNYKIKAIHKIGRNIKEI